MLRQLFIQNYALIEEADLSFGSGLTIITGETGAGKSILLGALGLVLGNRADLKKMYDPEKKCVVEALFDDYPARINSLLENHDLDVEESLVLRREIAKSGKSRAFVNDTPTTLNVLADISKQLIDLNKQHEINDILDKEFHYQMVDALAGNTQRSDDFRDRFRTLQKKKKDVATLKEKQAEEIRKREFVKFQHDELSASQIVPGELTKLETQFKMGQKVEEVREAKSMVYNGLTEGERSMESMLIEFSQKWRNIKDIGPDFQNIDERIDNLLEEVRALASSVEDLSMEIDENLSLADVTARIDHLNTLFQKHQAKSEEGLLEIFEDLSNNLNEGLAMDGKIEALTKEIAVLEKKLEKEANTLSKNRKAVVKSLEENVKELLAQLNMQHAQIKVEIQTFDTLTEYGLDDLEILFSPNKGSQLLKIKEVASGGERSRLMLCLKTTVADAVALPTMIFDEIDTGVSGGVAGRMGEMLASISKTHQVLSISHLPQVASRGETHFRVSKEENKNRVRTKIEILEGDDRILEIAAMLSEDPPSNAAIANAKDLLKK